MKNKWFFGFSVLLICGFFFMACPTDGGSTDSGANDDPFAGTWTSTSLKLVAANGSFKEYRISGDKEVIRGTYTYSGNTVSTTIIEVNTALFGGADAWVAYADLSETYKGYLGVGENPQITLNDNKFTSNGMTFTKQQ